MKEILKHSALQNWLSRREYCILESNRDNEGFHNNIKGTQCQEMRKSFGKHQDQRMLLSERRPKTVWLEHSRSIWKPTLRIVPIITAKSEIKMMIYHPSMNSDASAALESFPNFCKCHFWKLYRSFWARYKDRVTNDKEIKVNIRVRKSKIRLKSARNILSSVGYKNWSNSYVAKPERSYQRFHFWHKTTIFIEI